MPYFPDVSPGDKFTPNALLANELRHMVNAQNGFSDAASRRLGGNTVKIPVYNSGSQPLQAGHAVNVVIDSGVTLPGDVHPVAAFSDETQLWGVLVETLAPGAIGPCVLLGVASVRWVGSKTARALAKPRIEDGAFEGATAGARVIAHDNAFTTVLLGGGGNAGVDAVTARNNTDEDIPEGTAVMITAYGSIFSCRRALSTFYPWGVALQTIPVGGTGSVQISGTYPGASVGFDGTIVPSLRYVTPYGNTITFDRPVLNVGAVTPVPPYFGVRPVNFDGTTLTVNVSRGYYSINGGEVRGVEEKNITITFDASVDASRVLVLQIKRPETVPTDPSKYGWGAEIAVVNGISTNNMENYIFRQLARVEVSGRITQPGMVSDCVDFFYVPRFTVFEEN